VAKVLFSRKSELDLLFSKLYVRPDFGQSLVEPERHINQVETHQKVNVFVIDGLIGLGSNICPQQNVMFVRTPQKVAGSLRLSPILRYQVAELLLVFHCEHHDWTVRIN
jgi:hypothetical protein